MGSIKLLDCTLRDGGYVNAFHFGQHVIREIIDKLGKASIDIIECGFLRSTEQDINCTLFNNVQDIDKVIQNRKPDAMYVAMIQQGYIGIEEICRCEETMIDGIRLTFHEHEMEEAFLFAGQLKEKGYKVFFQPVGTTTYSDEALLELVKRVNELKPYAFYMVDTLGLMYKKDLLRMFYMIDTVLDHDISLGFHSHNNLQLSFANAIELLQINTSRNLIIDASVLGMGRGAGNLNTELIAQYINANISPRYNHIELLEIIDEFIRPLSVQYSWGYDAAYYISAVTNCHPNYAAYLMNKQTLHVQDIFRILNGMEPEKKALYDPVYIEKRYVDYLDKQVDDKEALDLIKKEIGNRKVLVLAPGKTIETKKAEIQDFCSSTECYVISVNFVPDELSTDMVFISNMKRFGNLEEVGQTCGRELRVAVTSNVMQDSEKCLILNYADYLSEEDAIRDNAGMMCLNMLSKIGVYRVYLAGFDGFSDDNRDNYYKDTLKLKVESEHLHQMNVMISRKLRQLNNVLKIDFITPTSYSFGDRI